MIAIPAVRALIREDKAHMLYSAIQLNRKLGMQTMNQSLAELCLNETISIEDALAYSTDVNELKQLIGI